MGVKETGSYGKCEGSKAPGNTFGSTSCKEKDNRAFTSSKEYRGKIVFLGPVRIHVCVYALRIMY